MNCIKRAMNAITNPNLIYSHIPYTHDTINILAAVIIIIIIITITDITVTIIILITFSCTRSNDAKILPLFLVPSQTSFEFLVNIVITFLQPLRLILPICFLFKFLLYRSVIPPFTPLIILSISLTVQKGVSLSDYTQEELFSQKAVMSALRARPRSTPQKRFLSVSVPHFC
jgi:hypothetical protein